MDKNIDTMITKRTPCLKMFVLKRTLPYVADDNSCRLLKFMVGLSSLQNKLEEGLLYRFY